MRTLLTVLIALTLMGCSTVRNWTVGQESVPQHEAITESQREAERTAADYLSRNVSEPLEAMSVAKRLSDLVGAPVAESDDTDQIIATLNAEIRDLRERNNRLERWVREYEGQPIEGTGWRPFGWLPGSWFTWAVAIIAIVALGGGPVLLMMLRGSRRTLRKLVRGIQDVSLSDPESARVIKARLKQLMSREDELLVDKQKLNV